MKILLSHNFYRSSSPSGEDAVYQNEKQLLSKHADVVSYEKYNDDIDDSTLTNKIKLAIDGAWSRETYFELTQLIKESKPDIAHFHNTFPQISPSAYAACQDNGVPVVQTLHNFRFICPNALLLRAGKPCEDCLTGSLLSALRHRCYRDSLLATGAQIFTIVSNRWRGTYNIDVNRYIALTSFAMDKLALGGLPSHKMEIKPNFLPSIPELGNGNGGYAVFVGRLSLEKGVKTLIDAWVELRDVPLKILGDGPLRNELESTARNMNLPIEFLGYCSKNDILKIVGNAFCQIIPSNWYEGFPMVALEAYACGTPLIVSRIGSLNEIVEDGFTGYKFQPNNPNDLAKTVTKLMSQSDELLKLRHNARQLFLERYTSEQNIAQLLSIYRNAISDFSHKQYN